MRTPVRLTALAALAALAAAGVVLAGCSGGTDQQAGTVPELGDQKVDIVFESYNLLQAGIWTDTVNDLISDFEAEHPNITVKAQPPQGGSLTDPNTVGSVQTQLLAGNPPDVAQLTFEGLDYAVTELGAKPLEELVGTVALKDHFGGAHPYHERAAVLADWNGQTYGLPYVISTPVLWYNATAFEKAGIPADVDLSTWEAVAEVGKKLLAATGKPPVTIPCAVSSPNWCLQGIFRSNGGRALSEDRTTIEFGEGGAVGAVEMFRDLYDEGLLANLDTSAAQEAFGRGDALIQLQTSAQQGSYLKAAKSGGWELRSTVMPAFGDQTPVPNNSGSGLFMFSSDPLKQAASWELMKFLTSDHAYETITSRIGYLPLRTSLTEGDGALAEWAKSNPLVAPNLAQLDVLEPRVAYPGKNFVQVDDILANAVEESTFYGKDPAKTMAEAQRRAQDLIKE
jgi:multiple sugar transport system substrate-binding protein